MSKYDKTISMSREEEGTYHRREYEQLPHTSESSKPGTSYHVETYRVPVRPSSPGAGKLARRPPLTSDDDDDDNFQEWTTSKRTLNHKTRQVETRVSRQILVEDGKVIADSGPQVITRIKEDNKVEECEKEKAPKNKAKFAALDQATEVAEANGRVLGEKKQIQKTTREVREENMQYHDERFKELTGHDVHRKAIQAPHELITINDKQLSHDSRPRGKMVHYSNKGKKYQDTDEILEVAKLAIDGSITKEVKHTKHHEEIDEDERPDDKGEAEALRLKPIVERTSRRHADVVNDFDDTDTPSASDADEQVRSRPKGSSSRKSHGGRSRTKLDDEAFPRYQIDPLLNSLRDEDFRPMAAASQHRVHRPAHGQRDHSSDREDHELRHSRSRSHRHQLVAASRSPSPAPVVEIPEEYRVNKGRLTARDGKGSGSRQAARERSFSPQQSKVSHRSSKSHRSHREDAAVQARLTDEEVERRSVKSSSSSGLNSHEKTTRHLQRQSNANSSRNYYYGDSRNKHQKQQHPQRRPSISSSASSLDDPKERMRQQGTRSRDSGFKSPHQHGRQSSETPISGGSPQPQIYSISSKSRSANKRRGETAVSPTPSAGQRSVKTTTTTVSGGLEERPLSRQSDTAADKTQAKSRMRSSGKAKTHHVNVENSESETTSIIRPFERVERRSSFDTISVSSLGPNATTIKVPYRRVEDSDRHHSMKDKRAHEGKSRLIGDSVSEMSFREDIQNLSKRLNDIKSSQRPKDDQRSGAPNHFNYKTIIENISPAPVGPKYEQHIDAYNVIIEQSSPFHNTGPLYDDDKTANLLSRYGIASQSDETTSQIFITDATTINNNEPNFAHLRDYAKYRAVPVLVDSSNSSSTNMDYDRLSLGSSCSLQSSRTYNIRSVDRPKELDTGDIEAAKKQDQQSVEQTDSGIHSGGSQQGCSTDNCEPLDGAEERPVFDEDGHSKRPAAWFFDPRDGSSTAIAAPARPKPDPPKVDAKTEDLIQSRGGRSYYLELIELDAKKRREARAKSIDSLYSRWTSHGALNNNNNNNNNTEIDGLDKNYTSNRYDSRIELAKESRPSLVESGGSRQITSPRTGNSSTKEFRVRPIVNGTSMLNKTATSQTIRRQLPSSGPPPSLGNSRSKSSSCLLNVTRPSKYSIYGGFRRPGENNKPVPRLSYSRAIGPKSQRQIDNQPKTPSRYLKMK